LHAGSRRCRVLDRDQLESLFQRGADLAQLILALEVLGILRAVARGGGFGYLTGDVRARGLAQRPEFALQASVPGRRDVGGCARARWSITTHLGIPIRSASAGLAIVAMRSTRISHMSLPELPQLRCFVGAFLERDSALRLARVLDEPALRARLVGLRHIDPSSFHVTLCFLGNVAVDALEPVHAEFAALDAHSTAVEATGLIGLPRVAAARVAAIELAPHAALAAWAGRLAARLRPADRRFRPHISVARSRLPMRFPAEPLAAPLPLVLEAPAVYRSDLLASGAGYLRLLPELD
jgi:2'-5' RNA ligase